MNITSQVLKSQSLFETAASCVVLSGEWQGSKEARSHAHVLRHLFEKIGIDGVLCIEGRPTVAIKDARELNAAEVEGIRHNLWNLGATTLLLAEMRTEAKVFSTLVRPSASETTGDHAALAPETLEDLKTAALALSLRNFIRRVETGVIYRDHEPLFQNDGTVDETLLKNLRKARDLITQGESKKSYQRAHALLGRFLFSCYLLDRGVIGEGYLAKQSLPEAADMLGLLDKSEREAPDVLVTLFESLQRDFNGSLFGGQAGSYRLRQSDVDVLRRFLAGEDLKSGQLSLFKLYDFSFVPVELISSIYEDFLKTEEEVEEKNGQRTSGAYYTPPRLAELTVDVATHGWDTLLDKRCLDPSCGSGVFLVILFIRMAEEWRARNPKATVEERYEGMLSLLDKNIRGIDIHHTACLVACFSLYLALLEQMEPREITKLRERLAIGRRKLLPRLFWEDGERKPAAPRIATVREADFFDIEPEEDFDLVVGNPPWVSRRDAPNAEAWLYNGGSNPYLEGLNKSKRAQTLFPAKEVACAFMWKSALHAKEEGRVSQVLPTRVFLGNNTDAFQAHWLGHHAIEECWFLADYRFILFDGANCPSEVVRYRKRGEMDCAQETFPFIAPKVERLDPRHAVFPVTPEDQREVAVSSIVEAAVADNAAAAWKMHFWATPRDQRLLCDLTKFPKLNRLVARPPTLKRGESPDREIERKARWWKGAGFQPFSKKATPKKKTAPWGRWWDDEYLYLPGDIKTDSPVLFKSQCSEVGNRFGRLRRTLPPELARPLVVLVNKGFTKHLFCDFPVVFQDAYLAIQGEEEDEDLLLFLTGYFNTGLPLYFLFHTSSNLGIERDIVRLMEVTDVPFPLPEETPNPERSEKIVAACADRLRSLKADLSAVIADHDGLIREAKRDVEKLVFEYFGISRWEQDLVRDTVDIYYPSSTPGSIDSELLVTAKRSEPKAREDYANTVSRTFSGWTNRGKKKLSAVGRVNRKQDLGLLTFMVTDQKERYREVPAGDELERVLAVLRAESVEREGSVFNLLRGFALYEENRVHVLKPLSVRHWTKTAALNDADEILVHLMNGGRAVE